MSVIDEYFSALNRLEKNKPNIVAQNTAISNDSVALEAGRKKGSIKKSRESFADLIVAIEKAQFLQSERKNSEVDKLNKLKSEVVRLRKLYEEGLAREVMLIKRVYELEDELSEYQNKQVVEFRKQ